MASKGPTRHASHAGSWYTRDRHELARQLDGWLDAVPAQAPCIGPVSAAEGTSARFPMDGARVVIAPHAGYSYSGPAAAWAYKSIDWRVARRVFILGPSHHEYLTNCALSSCSSYATPLGDLALDHATIAELKATGEFGSMTKNVDENEHSIEMHLPYVRRMLERAFPVAPPSALPPIIPILVGATEPSVERTYGALLAPYLADPHTVFVISSDFAHWGSRFRYTYYEAGAVASFSGSVVGAASGGTAGASSSGGVVRGTAGKPTTLRRGDASPTDPPIHESIAAVDMRCAGAVESGAAQQFWDVLKKTGNTVCGRHPIGVFMCAVESAFGSGSSGAKEEKGRFKFVRYERSNDCVSVGDMSVSYCSAFAVL